MYGKTAAAALAFTGLSFLFPLAIVVVLLVSGLTLWRLGRHMMRRLA
jgi:uncharacterized BrkB/YihY/UPF0761 family membrane protein